MKHIIAFLLLAHLHSFGQEIVSEEVHLVHGDIDLPGTLSYPSVDHKVPLVLFIHGSGNIDRNGNQGPLVQGNYIKLLADSLNAKGFGFYRYDKRTSNPENIKKQNSILLSDFVGDAKVAIEHFATDSRFSGIHLIGHSQGSLVAMLALDKNITSYISLAGAAKTIDHLIIDQIKQQDSTLASIATKHFQELKAKDTIVNINPFLLSLFAPQNQKFLKDWASYQPTEIIKQLKVPICILNGDKDLQVSIGEAQRLKAAIPDAVLHIIPKMNHILKHIENDADNITSYQNPKFPISTTLISLLTDFITTHG